MRQKLLSIILALLMVFNMFPVTTLANSQTYDYVDMPNNWSTEALTKAVENGLLSGYNNRLYPDKNLTRAEMAAVINRAFGAKKNVDISSYIDVKTTDWFYDVMSKAVGMGTFQGDTNRLRPNDPISREEVFSILSKVLNLRAETSNKVFSDINEVSVWAQESINGMINAGYVSGSNGKLNPKANITRAEFAQVIHNIIKDYVNTATVYESVNAGNVIVNTPNATLKDVTIKGDLIIAEGVGEGEVTLDNVKVEGRVLVRSGGENSIIIKGDSEIDTIVIVKQGNKVRIFNETGKEIAIATVEGTADVILEGKFKNVIVESSGITVYAISTEIENVEINGTRSKVNVDEASDIEKVVVRAGNVAIEGKGIVEEVEVKSGGSGTEITTPDTQINVDTGANNVIGTGGVVIESNVTYVNGKTESQDAKPLVQPPSIDGSSGETTVTTYTVNYSVVGNNGTLTGTVKSGNSVNSGTKVTFTATPNTGYEIKEWRVNGNVIAVNGNTLTRTINANTTVTVEFKAAIVEPTTYTLAYSVVGEGGTLTGEIPSGTQASSGSTVKLTAIPSKEYRVKVWTVNGTIISDFTATEYTAEMHKDVNVTVEFEPIPTTMYTVNFRRVGTVGELYATVEGVGHIYDGIQVAEGTDITFSADIPSGYEIKEWIYNGYPVEVDDNSLTISDINMDITVTVELALMPIIVSVEEFPIYEMNVGDNGPVLPETVSVTLNTEEVLSVPVTWDTSSFNEDIADNYVFEGVLTLPDGINNPMGIKAEYLVDVFAAPEITLHIKNTNILTFTFDVPAVWVGEYSVADIGTSEYPTLAFLQDLFGDPNLDANVLNEDSININVKPFSMEIILLEDAINKDLFYELDHPEGLYGGNGDGVYRKDVAVDLSIFNNHLGLASESIADPFKIKFFIPMENGSIDYSDLIQGVWQTQAQRDLEVDPALDTTSPMFTGITSNPAADEVLNGGILERHIWIEEGDSIEFQITATDDNLRRIKTSKDNLSTVEGFWYYADSNVYNGPTDILAEEDEMNDVSVTYANGTWTINFGPEIASSIPEIIFELDFEDYAGNRWSEVEPIAENRTFKFIPKIMDRSDLNEIKAEIAELLPDYYSPETWAYIEIAMLMPESTQGEIDTKSAALVTAMENLYELLAGTNDKYIIQSNSTNNVFYVLDNDRGTGKTVNSATSPTFGTTTSYANRIEYVPYPGFSGVDTFSYRVTTPYEVQDVTVTVTVEPSGTYITRGFASDGTEFGFYYDEGGTKVLIENENTFALYLDSGISNFSVIDESDVITVQYNLDYELHTKKIGTIETTFTVEPVVTYSELTKPLQALEINDVEGIGINEIEVGKTYTMSYNKVPSDSTDYTQTEWEIVSGDATINNLGEIVANSPGEIVVRIYNKNTGEIGSFSDEITLTAYNMYNISITTSNLSLATAKIIRLSDMAALGTSARVKEGSNLKYDVELLDPNAYVIDWKINGLLVGGELLGSTFAESTYVDKDLSMVVLVDKYNSSPVAVDDSAEVKSGSTVLVDVLANDTDEDGDTLSITGFTQGSKGTATQEGDSIRYTPNPGFIGMDEFMYEISDGNGGTSSARVTIIVNIDGTLVGTGEYGTDEIGIYQTPNGLTAVLENQASTTGLVIETGSDGILGIESMSYGVDVIYIYGGEVKIVTVLPDGTGVIEDTRQSITSPNGGSLSGFKYVVDSAETIHFTYLDSQGSPDSYNKPDLMYFNTFDGTEILVQRAYQDLSSSGSWGADYIESGYTIAVDNVGSPVIAYIRRSIWKWPNGIDTNFHLHIENPITQQNITIESNYKTNIYSNLNLSGGGITIGFSYDRSGINISGSITAYPLSVNLP
jgi:hypothetical protein